MKQRLPRVLRGRSGFVFGLVLIVAALAAPDEGRADAASLILEDVCKNPVVVFDHAWAKVNFSAADLYFMKKANGSVVEVSQGGRKFDEYEDLYVLAHGGGGDIDGMKFASFVDGLKVAHPTAPNSVMFKVCDSESLLKATYDKYGKKVNELTGSDGACRLTGDGKYGLKNATYRVGSKPSSGKDETEWNKIRDAVVKKWDSENYPKETVSYKDYCKSIVANFDAAKLRDFMVQAVADFSHIGTNTDYLKLVELNRGGKLPTVCGKNPAGKGVSVPCP